MTEDGRTTGSDSSSTRRPHVLLGLTGSVAAIKLQLLVQHLTSWSEVRVVVTDAARRFLEPQDIAALPSPLLGDEDEWRSWKRVGDPVLHIDLRRWADVLIIAPLSANTLAKLAGGLCDNLLTCVVRAWDYSKPLLVAPAMNTLMWENPFTSRHLSSLQELGVIVVPPISKRLACGDVGAGAMAEPADISSTCCAVVETAGTV